MDFAALRAELPITNGCAYMNHAAVGPVPTSVVKAAADAMDLQSQDPDLMNRALTATNAKARSLGAQMLGAAEDRIAFIGNTSHGLSMIANGLDWHAGDQIVVSDQEFPSNFLIWAAQVAKGAALVNLPLRGGCLTPEALAEVITARTRVVAISHVQYHNGSRADIAAMADTVHRHDALLVVDGTQSIGAMQFDLDGWGADALVFSAHKWMLTLPRDPGQGATVASEPGEKHDQANETAVYVGVQRTSGGTGVRAGRYLRQPRDGAGRHVRATESLAS